MKIKTAKILGVNISALGFSENLEIALSFLQDGEPACRMIFTPNPEVIVRANKDAAYHNIINSGDLVVADGIGIIIASFLGRVKINERTTGIDLITGIFQNTHKKGLSCYFLGGKPGVAQKAAGAVMKKFPGVRVAGCADGYFDKKKERVILKEIQRLKPDLLLVGLGFPFQEKWIYENKSRINAKAAIACGGCLDVFAGAVKRAPKLYRKFGLEWFYRLISQPSRFFRMVKLPVFLLKAVSERVRPS